MKKLVLWMRITAGFYLLQSALILILKAPIRALGPSNTLELADSGDAMAKFLVDSWIISGAEVGVIGVALLLASRVADRAKVLCWTVIGIELIKGPPCDLYFIWRGYEVTPMIAWIVIHTVFAVTGIFALGSARRNARMA